VNLSAEPHNTLVFGAQSTGKTSFAFRYLLNASGTACRFIFDDRGLAATRLRLKACNTEADCERALPSRWVCINPHFMFPGAKLPDGLRWFCSRASEWSGRGPGRKILFVDELWQWCDSRNEPADELQNVVRTGRTQELELLTCTHSPREFHLTIRRLVTEWVAFNTVDDADLDAVRGYWPGVDRVKTLPRGAFIAYNRESGAELSGRVF
jgi:hypothetical protein